MVAVGVSSGAQLLDLATGELLGQAKFNADDASSVAFSADSTHLLVGTVGGYLHVLDTSDLQPVVPRRLTTGGLIIDLIASPDGHYLATLGSDGDLLLWDTNSWQPVGQPIDDDNGWGYLTFDPDGVTLRSIHQNGQIVSFTVDAAAWIKRACDIANRNLTTEEFTTLMPGMPPRTTCES